LVGKRTGAQPAVDPSIYALVGSAAMITGVMRLTLSVCVIILEMTEGALFE
jgi:H+/Cl- antiporter ClcA